MSQIKRLFATGFALLIIISFAVPAYAEVTSLKTDKTLYKKNVDTTMTFIGTAAEGDINQIVTIVIYGPTDNFVKPAHSGYVGADKTFEVKIGEKDFASISSHGTYKATAFMKQKTAGVTITFDYSVDGSPIQPTTQPSTQPTTTPTSPTTSPTTTPTQSTDDSDGKSIQEKIQERIEAAKKQQTPTTDSTEKSIEERIQERIDAAKNQGTKTNTTGSTGGVKPTGNTTKEKPDSTGSDNPVSLDANILFIALGVGAAAAVAIAVYSMKLKPKLLAREVSDNVSTEPQPTDSSHEEDYALMILKNRLAKGEISVEEFNRLKQALQD
jgi:hypothetical protein